MVLVYNTYDSTVKEKIFVVKGEEAYARTTDCVLEELYTNNGERRADWNTHINYMLIEFRINVLRDIGASQVILYDNDEPLGVYEFDTDSGYIDLKYEDNEHDNRLKLNYDVEHNIYAVYQGNKKCLKSRSKTYNFYESLPDNFNPVLSFTLNDSYRAYENYNFKVKLTADHSVDGNKIKVYDGTSLIGEYTTDSSGYTPNISVPSSVKGIRNIRAIFDGNDRLYYTDANKDISIGHQFELDYPDYIINRLPSTVTVTVTDYFNNPVTGETVKIQEYNLPSYDIISPDAVTNSDGVAIINNVNISDKRFSARDNYLDSSEEYTIPVYDNVRITSFEANPSIISNNYNTTLTGTVSNVSAPVVVSLGDYGSVVTNSNGGFSKVYNGQGTGDMNITASIGGVSATVTVEDVIQYWNSNGTILNQNYDPYCVVKQSNGWLCNYELYLGDVLSNNVEDYSLSFKVKSVSDVNKINGVNVSLNSGDIVKIDYHTYWHNDPIYDDWSSYRADVDVYVNNILVGSYNGFQMEKVNVLVVDFNDYGVTPDYSILFDELKLKRI